MGFPEIQVYNSTWFADYPIKQNFVKSRGPVALWRGAERPDAGLATIPLNTLSSGLTANRVSPRRRPASVDRARPAPALDTNITTVDKHKHVGENSYQS